MRSRESARPRCDEEGEKRSSNSHLLSDRVAATSFVALNEANSRGILPVLPNRSRACQIPGGVSV